VTYDDWPKTDQEIAAIDQEIAAIDRRRQELQEELRRLREQRRSLRYQQKDERARETQQAAAARKLEMKQQQPMCYGPHPDSLIPKLMDRVVLRYCSRDLSREQQRYVRGRLEHFFAACTYTPEYFYQGRFHCFMHAPKDATPLPGVEPNKLAGKFHQNRKPKSRATEGG
jgi:hypothetical protein